MTRNEFIEYRRAAAEREVAEREYCHFVERREELMNRQVRNEPCRARFIARLNQDIEDAHGRLVAADLALEGFDV